MLVAVLVVSGLVLLWGYRPAPDGPEAVRTVHRLASGLLLPASWVLAFALLRRRTARWSVVVLFVLVVPAAAFTGFLLPWERVFYATAVVSPDVKGMGVAFDAAVASISFGGPPIARATVQRYVLAHLFLGGLIAVVTALLMTSLVRAVGRTRPGRASLRPGTAPGPPPRTRG